VTGGRDDDLRELCPDHTLESFVEIERLERAIRLCREARDERDALSRRIEGFEDVVANGTRGHWITTAERHAELERAESEAAKLRGALRLLLEATTEPSRAVFNDSRDWDTGGRARLLRDARASADAALAALTEELKS